MNFEKKVPDWKNVGSEPSEDIKKDGFKAGYKPPAAYFNWFFNRIGESVKELQNLLKALAFKDTVGNEEITEVSGSKVIQNSTHRFITDAEREKWDTVTNKVEKIPGKQLSTNDFTDEYKNRLSAMGDGVVVTIPVSSWSASAPYTSTIAVPGLKATDQVKVHAYTPKEIGTEATKLRRKLTGFITDGESEAGQMKFYCIENKPTADFDVLLEGVSSNG